VFLSHGFQPSGLDGSQIGSNWSSNPLHDRSIKILLYPTNLATTHQVSRRLFYLIKSAQLESPRPSEEPKDEGHQSEEEPSEYHPESEEENEQLVSDDDGTDDDPDRSEEECASGASFSSASSHGSSSSSSSSAGSCPGSSAHTEETTISVPCETRGKILSFAWAALLCWWISFTLLGVFSVQQ
jgi:hypothetical protein